MTRTERPPKPKPKRGPAPPWRLFPDLTRSEQNAVRKMYMAGDAIVAVAQRFRVYPGSIKTAAVDRRWPRAEGVESIARRVIAALTAHPTLKNAQIAKLVGCNRNYVGAVRRRLHPVSQRPAKPKPPKS